MIKNMIGMELNPPEKKTQIILCPEILVVPLSDYQLKSRFFTNLR